MTGIQTAARAGFQDTRTPSSVYWCICQKQKPRRSPPDSPCSLQPDSHCSGGGARGGGSEGSWALPSLCLSVLLHFYQAAQPRATAVHVTASEGQTLPTVLTARSQADRQPWTLPHPFCSVLEPRSAPRAADGHSCFPHAAKGQRPVHRAPALAASPDQDRANGPRHRAPAGQARGTQAAGKISTRYVAKPCIRLFLELTPAPTGTLQVQNLVRDRTHVQLSSGQL